MESEVFVSFITAFSSILSGINAMIGTGNIGLISYIKGFLSVIASNGLILAFVLVSLSGVGIGLVRRLIDS